MEREIKKQSIGFKMRWEKREVNGAGCSMKPHLGDKSWGEDFYINSLQKGKEETLVKEGELSRKWNKVRNLKFLET